VRGTPAVAMTEDKSEEKESKEIGTRGGGWALEGRLDGTCFASEAGMTPTPRGRTALCADHHHTRPPATTNTNEKDDEERWMFT